jgi:hypothetical protein
VQFRVERDLLVAVVGEGEVDHREIAALLGSEAALQRLLFAQKLCLFTQRLYPFGSVRG